MSSSRSRRERWKARVVFTAMKMSNSCSSGGCGLDSGCPGGSGSTTWGPGPQWHRRDKSPVHSSMTRAQARPRRSRHCMDPGRDPRPQRPRRGPLETYGPGRVGDRSGQAGGPAEPRVRRAPRTGLDGREAQDPRGPAIVAAAPAVLHLLAAARRPSPALLRLRLAPMGGTAGPSPGCRRGTVPALPAAAWMGQDEAGQAHHLRSFGVSPSPALTVMTFWGSPSASWSSPQVPPAG